MIGIKILSKAKGQGSGTSGGSYSGATYVSGTASEAEHAVSADKAKRAEAADRADYATKAGTAQNANYATVAGEIAEDSEQLSHFLRTDTKELQTVEGPVKFEGDVEANKATVQELNSTNISNAENITTKNLNVTGSAHFFEMIIDKVKSAGGAALFTPADGFDIDHIEAVENGYKLYWQCQGSDGRQRDNMWKVGDQALCMSFNQAKVGTSHSVSNKYYWCVVSEVSDNLQPVCLDDLYYNYIVISTKEGEYDGTVDPEVGDSISMLGYRGEDDKARQSATYISAYTSLDSGLTAPLMAQYMGINDFNLASHRKSYWDANGSEWIGNFKASNGETIEDYIKDQVGGAESGTPYIGEDGYWYIWDKETKAYKNSGIKAEGKDGKDGEDAVQYVIEISPSPLVALGANKTILGNYWQGSSNIGYITATLYKIEGDKKTELSANWDIISGNLSFGSSPWYSRGVPILYSQGLTDVSATVGAYVAESDDEAHYPTCKTLLATATITFVRNGANGANGKDGADGQNGQNGEDGQDGANAVEYSLSPLTELAAVDKNGDLYLELKYLAVRTEGTSRTSVYLSNTGFYVRFNTNVNSIYQQLGTGDYASFSKAIYQSGYNDLADNKRIDYFAVELVKGGTVYDRRIVPVKILPAAVFEITDDIKSTVQGYKNTVDGVSNRCSAIEQSMNGIGSTVSSNTQRINSLKGTVDGYSKDISSVKQTAEELTSTVTSVKNDAIGDNILLGQQGQGWTGYVVYQDAGSRFKLINEQWTQSTPIMDYSGSDLFSFQTWDSHVLMEIYQFSQTYYFNGIYDVECDFGTTEPCTIQHTSLNVSQSWIDSTIGVGKSYRYTITDDDVNVTVGDKVAIRVYNNTKGAYQCFYGTVTAISASSITMTTEQIFNPAKLICSLDTNNVTEGTEINQMHMNVLGGEDRYWVRWKEVSSDGKTFICRFKCGDTNGNDASLAKAMCEEGPEFPHKYTMGNMMTQSMIKQTAEAILMQVGQTYLKIGDGNITLNGDTKINGSLTIHDENTGFVLQGGGGTTEVKPKSIGSYSDFSSNSSISIHTNVTGNIVGAQEFESTIVKFSWVVTQQLGTRKKGDYIQFDSFYVNAWVIKNGQTGSTLGVSSRTYYIYENDVLQVSGTISGGAIPAYTVRNDNAEVYIQVNCATSASTGYWQSTSGSGTYRPAQSVDSGIGMVGMPWVKTVTRWTNTIPTGSANMLIGYDGWAANFGTNKTVYCGSDGFIMKYGDTEFNVKSSGISRNNTANTHVIYGSSSSSSPTNYTVQDPVDCVVCKSGYCKVTFPSNPYEGQQIKVFDKGTESWINSGGNYVVACNAGSDRKSKWTSLSLGGTVPRCYTFIDDAWYEEYMG